MDKETRVRLGAKQTAKGTIQMDITAEASSVEEAKNLLSQAVDDMTAVLEEKGLVPVHTA
jgi:hypothetical protein